MSHLLCPELDSGSSQILCAAPPITDDVLRTCFDWALNQVQGMKITAEMCVVWFLSQRRVPRRSLVYR